MINIFLNTSFYSAVIYNKYTRIALDIYSDDIVYSVLYSYSFGAKLTTASNVNNDLQIQTIQSQLLKSMNNT